MAEARSCYGRRRTSNNLAFGRDPCSPARSATFSDLQLVTHCHRRAKGMPFMSWTSIPKLCRHEKSSWRQRPSPPSQDVSVLLATFRARFLFRLLRGGAALKMRASVGYATDDGVQAAVFTLNQLPRSWVQPKMKDKEVASTQIGQWLLPVACSLIHQSRRLRGCSASQPGLQLSR